MSEDFEEKLRFVVANIKAPHGTDLRPIRDGQYSWPLFSDQFLFGLPDDQKQFLYLENNKAGFCMRIEIMANREIVAAGNGFDWIAQWPQLKRETEAHYQQKIELAGGP